MTWYYPYQKRERAEIQQIIHAPGGLRAGWMMTAYETTDWQWCRVVNDDGEVAERIAMIRECTEEEKEALNSLLWSDQICMRFKRVRDGNPWALARMD